MLSDQLGKKAVYITITGVEDYINIVNEAMHHFLRNSQNSIRGKITLKELNKQKLQLRDIPLSSKDLKGMERQLKKHGVDYAIKKDLSKDDSYKVFFKAKDIDSIELALKNYTAKRFSEERKPSFKETVLKYKEKSKEINKNVEKNKLLYTREER